MRTMYLIKALDKNTNEISYFQEIGMDYSSFTEDIYTATLYPENMKENAIESARDYIKLYGIGYLELSVEEVITEIKLTGKSEIITKGYKTK